MKSKSLTHIRSHMPNLFSCSAEVLCFFTGIRQRDVTSYKLRYFREPLMILLCWGCLSFRSFDG